MSILSRVGNREKFEFYNNLSILLQAVEGYKTTIDLRNEAYIYGTVGEADGFMNVVMNNCIFTDPRGDKYKFDTFFVQSRNIRCVHIPINLEIVPAINRQIQLLKRSLRKNISRNTFKVKRLEKKLAEDKAAVKKILKKGENSNGDNDKVDSQ